MFIVVFSCCSEIAIWDILLCLHDFLLITIANSLDPDQALQCRAWYGSKLFDTDGVPEKKFSKRLISKKKSADDGKS